MWVLPTEYLHHPAQRNENDQTGGTGGVQLASRADDMGRDNCAQMYKIKTSEGAHVRLGHTERYWRMACSDEVAVLLQTRDMSTPRPVVSVLLLGRCRVASLGDMKLRWRRSGKASPGRAEVSSPSLKSEPTPAVRTA